MPPDGDPRDRPSAEDVRRERIAQARAATWATSRTFQRPQGDEPRYATFYDLTYGQVVHLSQIAMRLGIGYFIAPSWVLKHGSDDEADWETLWLFRLMVDNAALAVGNEPF